MAQNFLKITYHLGNKKINTYLKMPSPTYYVLKKEIEFCLFEEKKQTRCEIRIYWIDDDQDEIEITNQLDYEIFIAKLSDRKHLQVAPINQDLEKEKEKISVEIAAAIQTSVPSTESSSSGKQAKIPPAAGSSQSSSNYDFAVHDYVECDACLMSPIIGFRYKCIQCPNYDLCQNCESKHIHSEHMMVRMPTNNCRSAYATGISTKGRRHDDDNDTNNATTSGNTAEAGAEQSSSSPGNGKESHHGRKHRHRHHRHNLFSHLYEMMHDLAEGGGAAAAAHAMGESEITSATKATTTTKTSSTSGPETTTTTKTSTTTSGTGIENMDDPIAAAAAAAAAQFASQHAHEAAVKTAEIAAKVAHEVAANAARNMTASQASFTFATANDSSATQTADKEDSEEKANNTSAPRDAATQPNSVPVIPSPSLETVAQFLDPQYMKTGIQILNNFSKMFSKMLDPMETSTETQNENQIYPNLRKNSTTSTKSNNNSLDGENKSDKEKSIEKEQTIEMEKQAESDVSCHIVIDDLGSDSENESLSESFIKLDAPKEGNTCTASTSKSVSAQTTPPQSLDKSKPLNFAQLSADLKAHIAEETKEATETNKETATDLVNNATTTTQTINSTTTGSEPVVSTTSNSTSSTSTTTTSSTNGGTSLKMNEEKRAVRVYHSDPQINNSVHAMMSMGFSNEGGWLTELMENFNGNINEALDNMTVAQRGGR
ncbi:refractory to sigma P isoform 2-T2 [Cochliomyia hominivorax]